MTEFISNIFEFSKTVIVKKSSKKARKNKVKHESTFCWRQGFLFLLQILN